MVKSRETREAMNDRRQTLRQELAQAYAAPEDSWRGGHIYALVDAIAELEREIADSRPAGDGTQHPIPER